MKVIWKSTLYSNTGRIFTIPFSLELSFDFEFCFESVKDTLKVADVQCVIVNFKITSKTRENRGGCRSVFEIVVTNWNCFPVICHSFVYCIRSRNDRVHCSHRNDHNKFKWNSNQWCQISSLCSWCMNFTNASFQNSNYDQSRIVIIIWMQSRSRFRLKTSNSRLIQFLFHSFLVLVKLQLSH